jgi:hypothetical protein
MVAGNIKLDKTWLGKGLRKDLEGVWHKFSENDKQTLYSIIKDQQDILQVGLTEGPDWTMEMNRNIQAQFSNISAAVLEDVKLVFVRRLGEYTSSFMIGLAKGIF